MLTDDQRWLYYQRLGYDGQHVRILEEIRQGCPARNVEKGRLHNSMGRVASRINGELRTVESYTVEHVYALELELDLHGGVLEYYCQPRIRGVEYYRNGRRFVHNKTLDFFVFAQDGIRLVECKTQDDADKLVATAPADWTLAEDTYHQIAVDAWGTTHGVETEVWTTPEVCGSYLANLQLLSAKKDMPLSPRDEQAAERLFKKLSKAPLSIHEAVEQCRGMSVEVITILLANKRVFGTLKSRLLDNLDGFLVSNEPARVEEIDAAWLRALAGDLSGEIDHPLARASATDYKRAETRLARVERIRSGQESTTRRYSKLVRAVEDAERRGSSRLAACLTNFAACGNHTGRLNALQEEAWEQVLRTKWVRPSSVLKGAKYEQRDLYYDVEKQCHERGVAPISPATIQRRLARLRSEDRALATGGKKRFHASRPPTDPIHASITPLAPWLVVHIDSTKWDQRLKKDVIDALPFGCPTTYVALHDNGDPVARAIMFGNACRDFLAVLMRDMVVRHGCLPRQIFHDGGSEYNGDWCKGFCLAYGVSISKPPTADAAKNSAAENGLGRLNSMLAHRLLGSTLPDQKGRSVDNRFKSYKNASMLFKDSVELFDKNFFGDIASTPTGNRLGSPREEHEYRTSLFGTCGIPVKYDGEFLWHTSIPITRELTPKGISGIRHEERTYRSRALSEALRTSKPEEIRRDCVDPSRLYVRIGGRIVRAFASDAQELSGLAECERLFRLMTGKETRSTNRAARDAIGQERHQRITRANASAAATAHLPVESTGNTPPPKCDPPSSTRALPNPYTIEVSDDEHSP